MVNTPPTPDEIEAEESAFLDWWIEKHLLHPCGPDAGRRYIDESETMLSPPDPQYPGRGPLRVTSPAQRQRLREAVDRAREQWDIVG